MRIAASEFPSRELECPRLESDRSAMLRSTRSRSALSHLLGVAAVLAVAVAPGPLGAVERHMLRFCTEAGFDGRCVNITGNDRDLSQHRRFPARLSSVWVEPADGLWQLCDSPRYTGTCMVVTRSIGDLGATPLRHRVRSVRWATSEAELVPIVDVPGGGGGTGLQRDDREPAAGGLRTGGLCGWLPRHHRAGTGSRAARAEHHRAEGECRTVARVHRARFRWAVPGC